MRPRELHSAYYRDRWTERELCRDFPGDAVLIDGLHTMQTHFWHNNVPIEIPIVRVMNTAHYLAAYMFATTCSGDQTEYEALASMSLGRDRQLCKVAIIVLAAMLERTDGFRARQCRTLLLDNRDPDFDEGVTLYDRFLKSAEKRFAEEDFLIDTHEQIQRLAAENEQLRYEKQQLEIKYRIMENQQDSQYNSQYNNCVINYAPVYNTNTTNNYYPQQAPNDSKKEQAECEDSQPVQEETPEAIESIIFTKKAKKEGKETYILQALQKSVQGRKDKTRAFVEELQEWQKQGYVDAHFNARVMYDELDKLTPLPFGYEVFKKHYNNTRC
ncbi:MAG: hypothetical protein J5884_03575 [Paludibacteraceae bacterium]|nr:hypothetical protein [Paludibacteraceae bacterium]